jgi:hypothetical protein
LPKGERIRNRDESTARAVPRVGRRRPGQ